MVFLLENLLDSPLEVIKDGIKKMLRQMALPSIFEAEAIDACNHLRLPNHHRLRTYQRWL